MCSVLVAFDPNDSSQVYHLLSLLSAFNQVLFLFPPPDLLSFGQAVQETLNQVHTFFNVLDFHQKSQAEFKFKLPKKVPAGFLPLIFTFLEEPQRFYLERKTRT